MFSSLAAAIPVSPRVVAALRVSDGSFLSDPGPLGRQWVLPPGSAVKPFVYQALLSAQLLRPSETVVCPGTLFLNGRNFTCSHPRGLPPMDAVRALAYSCNCATVRFAARFKSGALTAALQQAGFRARAGVDSSLQALGEEGVLVTPVEMAQAYRRLAQKADPAVLEGMEAAVIYGTARGAAVSGRAIAGKTGSALAANGLHAAWFAGFAPSRNPEVVLAVALQGRSGGADAAPIAAEAFRQYLSAGYRVRMDGRVIDLPVEEYVAAVLTGESSVFLNREALKAMAVAARTYAAHERGRHAKEGFDFCNTTHCQRAETRGISALAREAAAATAGEILEAAGHPAFTPYTMSCGGMAEASETVWPELRLPYLRVHPDPHCAPPVEWTHALDLRKVERALRDAGLDTPDNLRGVRVKTRTASGRARVLSLDGNRPVDVSASSFRFAVGRALGWNLIRSDWFETASPLLIHGKGEGHGVGLCQRGAQQMAAAGHAYREILAFYYPGITSGGWTRLGGEGVVVYVTNAARERVVVEMAEQCVAHLPWRLAVAPEIYVHPSLEAFRSATHEPGWVAARTAGNRIDMQPVAILERRNALRSTIRHELAHIAVEARAVRDLPIWFREGIADWIAGERVAPAASEPLEENLRQRRDPAKARQAYRQAQAYVAYWIARYSEAAVLTWVSAGLPDAVKKSSASSALTNSK